MNNECNDNRRKIYMKYNNSNIFSLNEGSISYINPKSALRKKTNHSFDPKYKEKTAREEYMKQFWNKEIKETKGFCKAKRFKQKVKNAEDIMCRDMYSNCNVKEYKMRRCKSVYLSRSNLSEKINQVNNVTSRKRKIDQMKSDIFFTNSHFLNERKTVNHLNKSKVQNKNAKKKSTSNNKSIIILNQAKKQSKQRHQDKSILHQLINQYIH